MIVSDPRDTLRGAVFMVAAMAAFAVEDALIKALSERHSAGAIITILGAGGAVAFGIWLSATGRGVWSASYGHPRVILRTAAEALGTVFFVSALTLVPLSTASAIQQTTPLVVALGAALFLGADVGWRRWLAISVGFGGVLLILRPGLAGFDPASLLAVVGMVSLAVRDLATRTLPPGIGGPHLSVLAFAALVPSGLLLMQLEGASFAAVQVFDLGLFGICIVIGMAAYLAIVAATRAGDIAVVSSLRYSRMVFALVIAMLAFGEKPDLPTLVGAAIIIASGLYTLNRERKRRAAEILDRGFAESP